MSEPTVFDFQEHAVRVIVRGSEPWFVAADVCRVLGINNARDAVTRLDEDEKGVGNTDTLGGKQAITLINESGLYHLSFKSRKPAAKAFRKWVTSEVLPAIRKTGQYVVEDKAPEVLPPIRFASVFSMRLHNQAVFDEVASFARFVKMQAQIAGLEMLRMPDDHLGSVRVFPEPWLWEQWAIWKETAAPAKYKKRRERLALRLKG